jgi:hypothetical protein
MAVYLTAARAFEEVVAAIREVPTLSIIDPIRFGGFLPSAYGNFSDLILCNSLNTTEKCLVKAQLVSGGDDDGAGCASLLLCGKRLDNRSPLVQLSLELSSYFQSGASRKFEFRTRVREGLIHQLFEAIGQHPSLAGLSEAALLCIVSYLPVSKPRQLSLSTLLCQ